MCGVNTVLTIPYQNCTRIGGSMSPGNDSESLRYHRLQLGIFTEGGGD